MSNVIAEWSVINSFSPSQSELITDHSAITFDIATPFKARPKIKRTVFDYNRGNFNELRATLETVDLSGADRVSSRH